MDIHAKLKIFLVSFGKVKEALKTKGFTLGNQLSPTVRPLLIQLYKDLHNLLDADGSLPTLQRKKD